jgi:acid phosphatase
LELRQPPELLPSYQLQSTDIKASFLARWLEPMRSIYEGILDMLTFFFSLLFSGASLAAVDSFYPPLNHTTYITNNSLGSYGGEFNAPSNHASATGDSGYNYCSMPHPHVDTYSLPRPVANHSVSAKLVYLEYLQRHQRRTPYNILPGGEVCLVYILLQSIF